MTKDLIQGFEAEEGIFRLFHSLRDLIPEPGAPGGHRSKHRPDGPLLATASGARCIVPSVSGTHPDFPVYRTKSRPLVALRPKCPTSFRASLDAVDIPLTLLGHHLRLEVGKQRFALRDCQAHSGRRDLLYPRNRAQRRDAILSRNLLELKSHAKWT